MDTNSEKLLFSISSLVELSESLITAGNFSDNSRAILHQILGMLLISKGVILYYSQKSSSLKTFTTKGTSFEREEIPLNKKEIQSLVQTEQLIKIEEPEKTPQPILKLIEEARKDFPDMNLWVTLKVRNELLGVILLGKKFMGQEFTTEDYDFLNIIARNVSVTIFNFSLINDLNRKINVLERREDELKKRKLEMEILYEVGLEVTFLSDSVEEISEKILMHAVSLLDARAGVLILTDDEHSEIIFTRDINVSSEELEDLSINMPIIQIVLDEKTPVIRSSSKTDGKIFGKSETIAAPIIYKNKSHGLFLLADKEYRQEETAFDDDDKKILMAFANQAAVAIENSRLYQISLEKQRIQREIELAAEIQKDLIPDYDPEIAGFEIEGVCTPSRMVGGDFYNYYSLPDGKFLVVVSDVSGKGVPAALLVSSINSLLFGQLESGHYEFDKLVETVSNALYLSSTPEKYATAFFIEIDPSDFSIRYINAGHNPPILYSGDIDDELMAGGFCLGMFKAGKYDVGKLYLQKDEILVVYTDGITEQINDAEEEFGTDRLAGLIKKNAKKKVKTINSSIIQSVHDFAESRDIMDDMTLLTIKKK